MHPQVSWILSRQVALTIVLAIAAGLVFDVNAAVSVVVGGLLTLVGFALVFLGYKDVAALPLFLGYASTFVIYWVALLKQR